MKDETLLIHGGRHPSDHFGAVNVPVFRASTIVHPSIAALEGGGQLPFAYGRRGTPTTRGLSESVAGLEHGHRTMLTPSGLSAISMALMSFLSTGDHLLMADCVYGPGRKFADMELTRFGIDVSYFPANITGEALTALFRPNTKVVFMESPGSITFEMIDIPAVATACKARGIVTMVDNTWATPLLFKPLDHGVDIAILAATKYLVGHADALMGTITANEMHAQRLVDVYGRFGLSVSGDDAYLTQRGMRTMSVRMARHQETALKMARWLQTRPEVTRVFYPALESHPGHAIWKRDYKGASGLFGIELKPEITKDAVAAMLDGLELFGMGYSWGGFESLIVTGDVIRTCPESIKPVGRALRIHAGLEDADELIADLDAGFDRMNRTAG